MSNAENFRAEIEKSYPQYNASIKLGAALFNNQVLSGAIVTVPLKTLNRHGLIAGATGTGKTKTLQLIAEGLSNSGVPVLLMDIKGDLSGVAVPGDENDKIKQRHASIGLPFNPEGFPVEFLSLSGEKGARLRATVSEFGPVLLTKILDLNDTQGGIIAIIFKYCDDKKLPLLDLKDLKKVLNYITEEGKGEIEEHYGKISTTSTGTILRKIIELEQQGAEAFFGERSFDVNDLLRTDKQGKGVLNIIRLTDIQDKPKLFSTFMLCLLAEVYATFPEQGDSEKPKLIIFIDEAHLVFKEASESLLDQLESIVKLIRSKGVGIVFCTQNPTDIPDAVLSQLGMKVQHALRAFTAKDRKMIKLIAENYPESDYYQVDELLTSLGIGEAAVSVLNDKGTPTPLVATLLCAPQSRMGVLSDLELKGILSESELVRKYNEVVDRESAFEMLNKKLRSVTEVEQEDVVEQNKKKDKEEPSTFETILNNPVTKQIGRTVARELARGLLGVLGIGTSAKRKKGWF